MIDFFYHVSQNLKYAKEDHKVAFITILATLGNLDNDIKKEEHVFLNNLSAEINLKFHPYYLNYTPEICIKNAPILIGTNLELELIKDMFILSYTDNNFTEEEAAFIYDIGKALKISSAKLKQISSWIADRIIWIEEGAEIFSNTSSTKKVSKKSSSKTTKKTDKKNK